MDASEVLPEKEGNVERGVISPEHPVEYLYKVFDAIPDRIYTGVDEPDESARSKRQEQVTERRHRLREALPHLPEIAQKYAELLRSYCDKLSLDPGTIRVYLVGGRVYGKPLVETSDFDIVLTVDNEGHGLQVALRETPEKSTQKRSLYSRWKQDSFAIDRTFDLTDRIDEREYSILEAKGIGFHTDEQFREMNNKAKGREAILIYSE